MPSEYNPNSPRLEVSPVWSARLSTLELGDLQDVKGESFRQDALDRLAGPKTEAGATNTIFAAQAVLDPANPFDPDAVAIFIGRDHVGYIPKGKAVSWHRAIDDLRSLDLPAVCQARIVGGWKRRRRDEGHYGVKLAVAYPPRPWPASHLDELRYSFPNRRSGVLGRLLGR